MFLALAKAVSALSITATPICPVDHIKDAVCKELVSIGLKDCAFDTSCGVVSGVLSSTPVKVSLLPHVKNAYDLECGCGYVCATLSYTRTSDAHDSVHSDTLIVSPPFIIPVPPLRKSYTHLAKRVAEEHAILENSLSKNTLLEGGFAHTLIKALRTLGRCTSMSDVCRVVPRDDMRIFLQSIGQHTRDHVCKDVSRRLAHLILTAVPLDTLCALDVHMGPYKVSSLGLCLTVPCAAIPNIVWGCMLKKYAKQVSIMKEYHLIDIQLPAQISLGDTIGTGGRFIPSISIKPRDILPQQFALDNAVGAGLYSRLSCAYVGVITTSGTPHKKFTIRLVETPSLLVSAYSKCIAYALCGLVSQATHTAQEKQSLHVLLARANSFLENFAEDSEEFYSKEEFYRFPYVQALLCAPKVRRRFIHHWLEQLYEMYISQA